jgi:RNA polymerase sigma-70 factor (ECF subfamily)
MQVTKTRKIFSEDTNFSGTQTFFKLIYLPKKNIFAFPVTGFVKYRQMQRMAYKDDKFYIEKVLKGETNAYADLVNKHKEMVFTIAVKILRNHEDAEEIAQDTFLKAFNALPNFKGDAKFSTWIYRIVYNTAISQSRKRKHEFAAINEEMIDNYTTDKVSRSVNEFSEDEQINAINSLMEKLPEEENLLLTLFYKNEKSIGDISEITGYTESNVKVKLYRLRKKMYNELEKHFNLN